MAMATSGSQRHQNAADAVRPHDERMHGARHLIANATAASIHLHGTIGSRMGLESECTKRTRGWPLSPNPLLHSRPYDDVVPPRHSFRQCRMLQKNY